MKTAWRNVTAFSVKVGKVVVPPGGTIDLLTDGANVPLCSAVALGMIVQAAKDDESAVLGE